MPHDRRSGAARVVPISITEQHASVIMLDALALQSAAWDST